jgi:hypothetical protein
MFHVLTNVFAVVGVVGVAWTVVGLLTAALFIASSSGIPGSPPGTPVRAAGMRRLKALDDPAVMDVVLRKTGSEGRGA